nr:translation initiation factor IF-2-like [Drosophila suzukii]
MYGELATVEHYNSEHQYEHTRHQSRGTQEDGGPPGTSPGARMVGGPGLPELRGGPWSGPETRTPHQNPRGTTHPRYEGEWLTDDARDGDRGAPLATPPWRPARPPTPRYMEPQRPEEQTPSEESTGAADATTAGGGSPPGTGGGAVGGADGGAGRAREPQHTVIWT